MKKDLFTSPVKLREFAQDVKRKKKNENLLPLCFLERKTKKNKDIPAFLSRSVSQFQSSFLIANIIIF